MFSGCCVVLSVVSQHTALSLTSHLASTAVSQEMARRMQDPSLRTLYDNQRDHPLLLVLDRRDDPVTPLLHQWSYQAMVSGVALFGDVSCGCCVDCCPFDWFSYLFFLPLLVLPSLSSAGARIDRLEQ